MVIVLSYYVAFAILSVVRLSCVVYDVYTLLKGWKISVMICYNQLVSLFKRGRRETNTMAYSVSFKKIAPCL